MKRNKKHNGKLIAAAAILLLCMLFAACGAKEGNQEEKPEEQKEAVTVVDQGGNEVTLPESVESVAVTPKPWASVVWAIDGGCDRLIAMNPAAKSTYQNTFLANLSPDFADVDVTAINKDFTLNTESIINLAPDVVFIWNDQDDEKAQLEDVGITAVMLNYAKNLDDLNANIRLVGKVLGKEEKADELIAYHQKTMDYFEGRKKEVEQLENVPSVLYLRSADLQAAGSDNINTNLLKMTGAVNAAGEVSGQWVTLNMEQIMAWDPDIIYLSGFDTLIPEDLYNNAIEGQDWSQINAVKNKRVYRTPAGVYIWDAPCIETPLMLEWMASIQQPELFEDLDVRKDTTEFYQTILGYNLTGEDVDKILHVEVNK